MVKNPPADPGDSVSSGKIPRAAEQPSPGPQLLGLPSGARELLPLSPAAALLKPACPGAHEPPQETPLQ